MEVVVYGVRANTAVDAGTGLCDLTHHVAGQGGQGGVWLAQVLGAHYKFKSTVEGNS